MHAPSRRRERRKSIVEQLRDKYPRLVDLSYNETRPDQPAFLGTAVCCIECWLFIVMCFVRERVCLFLIAQSDCICRTVAEMRS